MKHGINCILEPKVTKGNEFVNTINQQILLISTNLNSKIQQKITDNFILFRFKIIIINKTFNYTFYIISLQKSGIIKLNKVISKYNYYQ